MLHSPCIVRSLRSDFADSHNCSQLCRVCLDKLSLFYLSPSFATVFILWRHRTPHPLPPQKDNYSSCTCTIVVSLHHRASLISPTIALTLPMLRLLSANAERCKDFETNINRFGINWIALSEYSHMSTHVPGFQSLFQVYCIILYWPS